MFSAPTKIVLKFAQAVTKAAQRIVSINDADMAKRMAANNFDPAFDDDDVEDWQRDFWGDEGDPCDGWRVKR